MGNHQQQPSQDFARNSLRHSTYAASNLLSLAVRRVYLLNNVVRNAEKVKVQTLLCLYVTTPWNGSKRDRGAAPGKKRQAQAGAPYGSGGVVDLLLAKKDRESYD